MFSILRKLFSTDWEEIERLASLPCTIDCRSGSEMSRRDSQIQMARELLAARDEKHRRAQRT